jgi:hypothetical protein
MNLFKVLKKVLNSLKLKHFRKHLCQFKQKQFHKRIINLIHEISYSWLLNAIFFKKKKKSMNQFQFFWIYLWKIFKTMFLFASFELQSWNSQNICKKNHKVKFQTPMWPLKCCMLMNYAIHLAYLLKFCIPFLQLATNKKLGTPYWKITLDCRNLMSISAIWFDNAFVLHHLKILVNGQQDIFIA